MNLRQLSLAQWVTQLWRSLFGSQAAEPAPAETKPAEIVPRSSTAQSIQSRLAAQGIPLQSTLRVLWMRPSRVAGEWELVHPFSKAPLSVYEDEVLAMQVAIELLGREGGGSIVLLDANGKAVFEEGVSPLEVEDTPVA